MKKMKKFIALCIALLIVISLAACTKTDDSKKSADATTAEKSTTSADAGKTAGSADKTPEITLKYWDMLWSAFDSYEPTVKGLANKFTEKTGIKVEVQIIPWENHYQTFMTAINSGAAPDVCTGGAFQAVQYAAMDQVLDLSSIIEEWKKDGSNILDDFIPGSIELQQYKGIQAGIPWNSDVRILYYRTDYFADAGYKGKDAYGTHTFDELLKIFRDIKKVHPDVIPFIFPAGDYTGTHIMLSFMAANGTGVTDENYQANLESKEFKELLQFFATCRKEGLVSESAATYVDSDIQKLYASGKVAMVWGPNPSYLEVDYPDIQAVTDLMEAPIGPSGKAPKNLVWINPIIGFKQTKHPEETKAFIKFWAENNLTVYVDGKTGPLPVRKSFLNDPYFTSAWLPVKIVERNLLNTASSPVYPAANLYPEIADIEGNNYVGEALQRVLLGETDFDLIAAEQNAKIVEALKVVTNK